MSSSEKDEDGHGKVRMDLESDEEDLEGDEEDDHTEIQDIENEVSARPRRMSEFNMGTKIIPIPPASSFFIFSPTNRYGSFTFYTYLSVAGFLILYETVMLVYGDRFRIFCHWVCNHSLFGNIILVCIMISSAMLAAEDPIDPNSQRNKVTIATFYFVYLKKRRKFT